MVRFFWFPKGNARRGQYCRIGLNIVECLFFIPRIVLVVRT